MSKATLQGTLSSLFQVGRRGPLFRSLAGVLSARDAANAAYTKIQAADPTIDDDLVTLRYYNANMAGGSGNTGTATLNFGAFPGATDTSVAVTGQTGITGTSKIQVWLALSATAEHTADEIMVDAPDIYAGNIVAGTGFTIYGITNDRFKKYGNFTINWRWS